MKNNCSINNKYNKTCMKMNTLKKIAKRINKDKELKDIDMKKYTSGNKDKLLKKIKKELSCNSNIDFCILKKEDEFYDILKQDFKPRGPVNNTEWLSSLDIIKVMDHYEKKYNDFEFLGPFPIDFEFLYKDFMELNIKKLIKNKKKLGLIFNTDVSSGPGEHWISIYLDIKDKTICFFDSVGEEPPKEIKKLLNNLKKSCKSNYDIKMNIIINNKQFQFDNSSCGVWSLWHIISRLNGKSCDYIYNKGSITDKLMYKKRKEYFRK